MEKRISLKTLYLLAIIAIGLVLLGFGSTYALFTASASIDNPIYIASNLSYGSDIMDTVDVTISPGETEYVILNINNTSASSLNYVAWYIDDGKDIDFGVEFNETAETLGCNTVCNNVPVDTTGVEVKVYIRNNQSTTITVTIGVSSSSSDVILANNMTMIPNQDMPYPPTPLSDFTYVLGSKATTYTNLSYYDTSTNEFSDFPLAMTITIDSDEILLTKYIGSSEIVVIPNTYTVGGVTYNTVVLSCATDSVDLEKRMGTFINNTLITDVIFKDNVKTLSYDYYDTGNKNAYTSSAYLFESCTSLVNVLNLPDEINLMYYTFSGCTSLVNAPAFPSSLTNLIYTFNNCTSLKNVPDFPDSISYLTASFYGCTSLETVPDIPESVNSMVLTFRNCTNLTGNINILSSDISIARNLFIGVSNNITINVPAGSTTFNTFANAGLPSNVKLVGR